jgi:Cu+-exporting ATPase
MRGQTIVEVQEHDDMKEGVMAKPKVKDVVCGMEIEPGSAVAAMEYQGNTYHFCSAACRNKFTARPQEFVESKK